MLNQTRRAYLTNVWLLTAVLFFIILIYVGFLNWGVHVKAANTIQMSEVQATNGTLNVEFSSFPVADPVMQDFEISLQIGIGSPVSVTPTAMTWSRVTNKVILSVPHVPYGAVEQQLRYSVTYEGDTVAAVQSIVLSQGLTLADNGLANSVVIAPSPNVDGQARDAAWKLTKYVKRSTGIDLAMITDGDILPTGKIPIYVGIVRPQDSVRIGGLLDGLDGDGFVIDARFDSVTIIGSTSWGTEFGVNEFLERYLGVRWLLPGSEGEDVPQLTNLTVAIGTVVEEPSFFSRSFGSADDRDDWARENRIYRRVYLNHSMFELFAPSKYLAQHPDWYPIGGVNPSSVGGWQPCYSNRETAEEAVRVINQFFTDNPEVRSYSIGVNDGDGFCEGNPSHPAYTGQLNSLGMLNMSDVYYSWVQTVAEGVFTEHPDRFLSTMAYHGTYDPPSTASGIELPSNVVVYITDERLNWADPDMALQGKALTERWKEVAPGAAFYEYLYGGPYVLPRSNFHQLASNYRYALDVGIVSHVSEAAPNFGEGPKLWLSSKLQWNANADVDELLHDWYVRTVGDEAAPYLASYYAHWEDFWENRVFSTSWYQAWKNSNPRQNFMTLTDASYLSIVTEAEIAQSRTWLETAVTKAAQSGTAAQLKRAQTLLKAFEYYEASVLTFPGNLEPAATLTSASAAIDLLDGMVTRLALSEKRRDMVKAFKSDNILSIYWEPEEYGMMWSGIQSADVQLLVDWIGAEANNGAVRTRMDQIISTETSAYAVHYVKLMLAMADNKEAVNQNTSLEQGSGKSAIPWWYWLEYGQSPNEHMYRSDEKSRTGSYGLKVAGAKLGGLVQDFKIDPGYHGMSAYYYVPAGTEPTGTVQIFIYYRDANNEVIGTSYNDEKMAKDGAGAWHLMEWVGKIPEKIKGVPVDNITIGVKVVKYSETDVLYLDDVSFFRLSDPYIPPKPGTTPLNENGSFELSTVGVDDAASWSYWIDPVNQFTTTAFHRSNEQSRSENYSLKAEGMKLGALSQILSVQPGDYKMSAWYYTPIGSQTTGKIKLYVDYLNQNGQIIGDNVMLPIATGGHAGSWVKAEWTGTVPAQINGTPVARIRMAMLLNDFAEGESIYLDDFHLFRDVPEEELLLNENTSFEKAALGAQGEDAAPWSYWIDNGTRTASTSLGRSNEKAHTGSYSLKADSVALGAISQVLPIEPGDYRMTAWYYTPSGSQTSGEIKLYVDYLNQSGQIIGDNVMVPIGVSSSAGQWAQAHWSGSVSATVNGQTVSRIRMAILLTDFAEGEIVYLDDVHFLSAVH